MYIYTKSIIFYIKHTQPYGRITSMTAVIIQFWLESIKFVLTV